MPLKFFIAFLLISAPFLNAESPSEKIKEAVAPYLLPADHEVKPFLDAIFSQTRVTLNLHTLVKAGFVKTKPRKFTSLLVTKHPDIPGYIFKLYLDAQRKHKNKAEHHYWILRIQGAEKIRHVIRSYGLETHFKVPKKWIYALPDFPKPPHGYCTKHYILVEEDMEILSSQDNKERWASEWVSQELLDHLYRILKEVGLADATKPDNLPFSIDGRVAFVDTQTFDEKVTYKRLSHYLSEANKTYWNTITEDL